MSTHKIKNQLATIRAFIESMEMLPTDQERAAFFQEHVSTCQEALDEAERLLKGKE